jgi:hypothetical protein
VRWCSAPSKYVHHISYVLLILKEGYRIDRSIHETYDIRHVDWLNTQQNFHHYWIPWAKMVIFTDLIVKSTHLVVMMEEYSLVDMWDWDRRRQKKSIRIKKFTNTTRCSTINCCTKSRNHIVYLSPLLWNRV